jgi:hypothetical protein
MSSGINLSDWWNQWKNADPSELWKMWTTGWKDWVPDPAKNICFFMYIFKSLGTKAK